MAKAVLLMVFVSACVLRTGAFTTVAFPACMTACTGAALNAVGASSAVSSAATYVGGALVSAGAGAGATAGVGAATGAVAATSATAAAATSGVAAAGGAAVGGAAAAGAIVPVAVTVVTVVSAGLIAACAASCACFDGNVSITSRRGALQITSVRKGDEVLTVDGNGNAKWTRVLNTLGLQTQTPFDYVKIQAGNLSLSATATHPVIVKLNGENTVREAGNVVVGDVMVRQGNVPEPVTSISSFVSSSKYLIQTVDGTVLADGLLVHTLGVDELPEDMMSGRLEVGDTKLLINELDAGGHHELSFEKFALSTLGLKKAGRKNESASSFLDMLNITESSRVWI